MDKAYEAWQKAPTPENLTALIGAASPVIDSALSSYGSGDPALRGRAKILAVGAVRSFDPKQGVALKTHLMNQLKPLHREAAHRSTVVSVPEKMLADSHQLYRSEQEFIDEHGREPNVTELAARTGYSPDRIAKVREAAKPAVAESLGVPGTGASHQPGVQRTNPQQIWLEFVHHDLGNIDKKILEWKKGLYGQPVLANQEIAQRLNLSPGAVSQRSARIAARLAEGLPPALTGDMT